MPIDRDALLAWEIPEITQAITARDAMLYALGVGYGCDPLDERELPFVYQERLRAAPTLAVILCYPGQWHAAPGTGITSSHVVQGTQWFRLEAPLQAPSTVRGRTRVTQVYDKGPGRGALVTTECSVRDAQSDAPLCTIGTTHYCRADGGFGGPPAPPGDAAPMPARPPDRVCELATLPQAGLLYRLSGDRNPIHVDPARARSAGFPRPLLHGRCTFGVAGRALLRELLDYDADRLKHMEARFAAPVYPGEAIKVEMWEEAHGACFRASVPQRDVVVLDRGRAEYR
jgi:acyl dehydratase